MLLLFPQLRSRLQKCLEIVFVPFVLEQINLGQKLLLFLLKLGNLLLEFVRIHLVLPEHLHILMAGLELGLQILVHSQSVAHVLVNHKLIRNLQRHQEFSCIGFAAKIRHPGKHPPKHMLKCLFFSVDHIAAEVRIKVTGVSKHLKEPTHSLFCFVLGLFLKVDGLMGFV